MSNDVKTWLDQPAHGAPSPEEDRLRARIRKEARAAGTVLSNTEQRGGILPSLALGIFRRDNWRCKVCDGNTEIELHHKGGIPESAQLARKGHADVFNNLVTVCHACHDRLHEEHREEQGEK